MPSKRGRTLKKKAVAEKPAELVKEPVESSDEEMASPKEQSNEDEVPQPSDDNPNGNSSLFANLKGVGENVSDDDDETIMETLALSDIPSETLVEVRNDEPAIERKLSEIALFTSVGSTKPRLSFRDSLTIMMPAEAPMPDKLAIDDFEREKQFATRTTAAVHIGLERLRKERVRFRRPNDYYAQMVKTDEQMGKVKKRIMSQKSNIEAAETRRNNRDISKNRKKVRQVQVEKEQDKKRKAKEEIEAVSRVRKQRLWQRAKAADGSDNDNDDQDDEFPIEMLDVEQLDEDSRFQKHDDIKSGKKKAWAGAQNDTRGGSGGSRGGRGGSGGSRGGRGGSGGSRGGRGGSGVSRGGRGGSGVSRGGRGGSDVSRGGRGGSGGSRGGREDDKREGGEGGDNDWKGKKGQNRGNFKANGGIKKGKGTKKRLGRSRRMSKK